MPISEDKILYRAGYLLKKKGFVEYSRNKERSSFYYGWPKIGGFRLRISNHNWLNDNDPQIVYTGIFKYSMTNSELEKEVNRLMKEFTKEVGKRINKR